MWIWVVKLRPLRQRICKVDTALYAVHRIQSLTWKMKGITFCVTFTAKSPNRDLMFDPLFPSPVFIAVELSFELRWTVENISGHKRKCSCCIGQQKRNGRVEWVQRTKCVFCLYLIFQLKKLALWSLLAVARAWFSAQYEPLWEMDSLMADGE